MTHKKKRLIIKGVVTPVIISILLSAVCVAYMVNYHALPFTSKGAQLAVYSAEEIKQLSSPDDELCDNAIIGTVSICDSTFPIIYNANEVNANGKFNLMPFGAVVGMTGASYMELYKNDSAKLKLAGKGDIITVSTCYGEYSYKIYDTFAGNGLYSVNHAADGIANALVLYTDNSVSPGISDEYFIAVCTPENATTER